MLHIFDFGPMLLDTLAWVKNNKLRFVGSFIKAASIEHYFLYSENSDKLDQASELTGENISKETD